MIFKRKRRSQRFDDLPAEVEELGEGQSADESPSVDSLTISDPAAATRLSDFEKLQVSAVYRCIDVILNGIATMPLKVYQQKGKDRLPLDGHEYENLFNCRANAEQTAVEAWSRLIVQLLVHGLSYAMVERSSPLTSAISGWRPLNFEDVEPVETSKGLAYRVCRSDRYIRHAFGNYNVSLLNDEFMILPAEDVICLSSLISLRGQPVSPLAAAGVAPSVLKEAQKAAIRFFKEGGAYNYAIVSENPMTAEQRRAASEAITRQSGRPLFVFSKGTQPLKMSVDAADGQAAEMEAAAVKSICTAFGIPPHMIGIVEKSTSWQSGLEAQNKVFFRLSLSKYTTQIEQEFSRKLWPLDKSYSLVYDVAKFVSGTTGEIGEAVRLLLGRAGEQQLITVNEARRLLNLPPVDGGDELAAAEEKDNGSRE